MRLPCRACSVFRPATRRKPEAVPGGLFTNLWGPDSQLVHPSTGLSALTSSGALFVPKAVHTVLLACAGFTGVVLYWRRFESVRWLRWLAFAPLLFFNYRSLANVFIAAAPVATMVPVARYGRDSRRLSVVVMTVLVATVVLGQLLSPSPGASASRLPAVRTAASTSRRCGSTTRATSRRR
jgi:hypothetical protein